MISRRGRRVRREIEIKEKISRREHRVRREIEIKRKDFTQGTQGTQRN